MNLRQRVKKAKAELKALPENPRGNSQWEIYEHFNKKMDLLDIIAKKRKKVTYYGWNEEYEIDWNALTYVSVHADFTTLAVLKTPNGKPMSLDEINVFLSEILVTKLKNYSKEVTVTTPKKEMDKRVDYFISVSNDRTKNKKLHRKMVFYQFEGSDKIYAYKEKDKE